MDLALEGHVVWITGASGGIGRAVAETLAAEGALLALHGNASFDQLTAWVDEQEWREQALCVRADVRSAHELDANAAEIRERFGRIDACVANAGIWPRENLLLDQLSPERLRDTLEVDLLGPLFTARAFLAGLRADGPRTDGHGASLVLIGSTAGRFGERGHSDYAAAKAGLVGVMRSLKNEICQLDPYGRVNLVEPGWTVTHMAREALNQPGAVERATRTMALRQLGRAADVARTVAFLCSPRAASHVTGQVITVAGGMEGRELWGQEQIDREAIFSRLGRD